MPRSWGRGFIAAVASLCVVLGTATAADAGTGPEWSADDPIFTIDGRDVHVLAEVAGAPAGTTLHYTLTVSRGSTATWAPIPGKQFTGTVEIVQSKSKARDRAKLVVSAGKDANYPLRLTIDGPGLRNGPIERQGRASGLSVTLRLTPSADQDSDDD